jgi:hypothetical protein
MRGFGTRAGRRLRVLAAAGVLLAPGTGDAARAAELRMSYDVYVGGMRLVVAEGDLALTPDTYSIALRASLTGIASRFSDWRSTVSSTGEIDGERVTPRRNVVERLTDGKTTTTVMTFRGGGDIGVEVTKDETETRDLPVPRSQLVDALDPLSGVVALLRSMAGGAPCSGQIEVFDGKRLYLAELEDQGMVELERSERAVFGGPALRCRMTLSPVAGELDFGDQNASRVGRPTDYFQGSSRVPERRVIVAYLASPSPGAPAIPLRLESDSLWGKIVIHLQSVRGTAS